MNTDIKTSDGHVVEKVEKLKALNEIYESYRNCIEKLQDDVVLDIIDGWTTGDEVLDFMLVACDGEYDQEIMDSQYRWLTDLALTKPDQRIMIIQKSEAPMGTELVVIRNIYLATLRCEEIDYDINNLSIGIPVMPNYYFWREIILDDTLLTGSKLPESEYIKIGPLANEHCNKSICHKHPEGAIFVPEESVCEVILLSEHDPVKLSEAHGIDQEMLANLHREWTRYMSTKT